VRHTARAGRAFLIRRLNRMTQRVAAEHAQIAPQDHTAVIRAHPLHPAQSSPALPEAVSPAGGSFHLAATCRLETGPGT